jgi:hypothetical protein
MRFVERAVLPPYEGSMIRGAFGRAFKESCCPFPHDGDGCPLGESSPYGYLFETSPPEEARDFAVDRLPRLSHLWPDADYTGQERGVGWVQSVLGWTAEIVRHPPKPAPRR